MLEPRGIQITPDGQYITYFIGNTPVGDYTTYIKSTTGSWSKSYIHGATSFSKDSKWCAFQSGDSLLLIKLGEEDVIVSKGITQSRLTTIDNITYCTSLSKDKKLLVTNLSTRETKTMKGASQLFFSSDSKWIAWQSKTDDSANYIFNIYSLTTQKCTTLNNGPSPILKLQFNSNSTCVLYQQQDITPKDTSYSLRLIKGLKENTEITSKQIHSSTNISTETQFDKSGSKIVFKNENAIWLYEPGYTQAQLKIKIGGNGLSNNWEIADFGLTFSRGSGSIFFRAAQKVDTAEPNPYSPTVWRFDDSKLRNPASPSYSPPYLFAYNLTKNAIYRIEEQGEAMAVNDAENHEQFLLLYQHGDYEYLWQKQQRGHVSLINLETGTRNIFNREILYTRGNLYQLNPNETFIVYYDQIKRNYFSYEIASNKVRNITSAAQNRNWENDYSRNNYPAPPFTTPRRNIGLVGWAKDEDAIIVYDQNDLFRINLTNQYSPKNITNDFGKKNKINFKLTYTSSSSFIDAQGFVNYISDTDRLIFQSFNKYTKECGLYLISPIASVSPTQLLKGQYIAGYGLNIKKAADANTWYVVRGSATNAPNIYITKDLKTYTQISENNPERKYNWYTTELINWKLPTGVSTSGILYKPEVLDVKRKYPIIFELYEIKSDSLNSYSPPTWTGSSSVNIPFYINNGYLIFKPDVINAKIGAPGPNALDAVVSAANYLCQRKYIDKNKMGIVGHSFGGFEVNYIISHTPIFAAASEGAGLSDFISGYGSFWGINTTQPAQFLYEYVQPRMGTTPWMDKQRYLHNSPILSADKVNTPLLILHNISDDSVPFAQGTEWFTALRRLGKKTWMLQYNGEYHDLSYKIGHRIDYSMRLFQFFNHFLKNNPQPDWMKQESIQQ